MVDSKSWVVAAANAFPMTIWPQHVRSNWEKCSAKKPQKYSWGSSYLTSGQSDWQKDRHRVIWKKNHATVCLLYLHHTNNYLALHSSMLACMLSRYVYKVCTHSGTKKCSELVLFYIFSQVTPLAWTKYLILTHNTCMKIVEIFENASQIFWKKFW